MLEDRLHENTQALKGFTDALIAALAALGTAPATAPVEPAPAPAPKASKSKPKAAPAPEPEPEVPEVSVDLVRDMVVAYRDANGKPALEALLKKHGSTDGKFATVPVANYGALVAAIREESDV